MPRRCKRERSAGDMTRGAAASIAACDAPGSKTVPLDMNASFLDRRGHLRGLLPAPGRVISNIPLWDAGVILEWARATGRLAA